MALIQFEDLPSTNTPLNASNLNNNFSELNGNINDLSALVTDNTPTAIANSSITTNLTGASLSQNHSFKIGGATKVVFLNLKFAGVNASAGNTITLATLNSSLVPSSETSILVQTNGSTAVYGWLRSNGEIAIIATSILNDADIRIVTNYI